MLRFLIATSLRLLIVFAGIGLLICQQWGWPEYASPELYVIGKQGETLDHMTYFMVNADGSGQQWKLTWNNQQPDRIACSPDGRTLAFTNSGFDPPKRLFIVNQNGLLYSRMLDRRYSRVHIANNRTVTLFYPNEAGLLVDGAMNSLPLTPEDYHYDTAEISSAGLSIWDLRETRGIKVMSPSGETIITVPPRTYEPRWLASEQLFTFLADNPGGDWNAGIVDMTQRRVLPLQFKNAPYGILSPDATVRAEMILVDSRGGNLHLVDALSDRPKQQLTYTDGGWNLPLCFLTFRPQMLLVDNP